MTELWTYTCFDCGKMCTDPRKTKAEARKEMVEVFGDVPEDLCVTYCEACVENHPGLDDMEPVAEA